MKTMKLFIYLLILISLLESCEKKDIRTTVVRGKIINAGSLQPIDSVKVTLIDGVNSADEIIPGETSSGKESTVYTNSKGEFELQISGEYKPFIAFYKKKYIAPDGGLVLAVDWGAINDNLVFKMTAVSSFNPILLPKSPFTSGNICPAKSTAYGCECEYLTRSLSASPCRVFGDYIRLDGDTGWASYGDMYQKYKIELLRNGVKEIVIDSVFIKSLENYCDTICF